MKKIILIALISFTTICYSQYKPNYDYVKYTKPITWTKKVINSTTTYTKGNKTSNTIAGGAIGHILFKKSIMGTIGGVLVGNSMGGSDDSQTIESITYVTVTGYKIFTSKGYNFKSFNDYPKFKVLNLNTI